MQKFPLRYVVYIVAAITFCVVIGLVTASVILLNQEDDDADFILNTIKINDLLPDETICGISEELRITGGMNAELDEFPWMALIESEKSTGERGFYCGGALISKKYILTAAHCVIGKDWKLVKVRLGEYDTNSTEDCVDYDYGEICAPPAIDFDIEEMIPHEKYDPMDKNHYHDIALLRLVQEVEYSEYITPICLPRTTTQLQREYLGKKVWVAGWGKNENGTMSNIKQKLEVPVRSTSQCNTTYYTGTVEKVQIRAGQLCAGGERDKDSCMGDSGGPLMALHPNGANDVNWFAIGVVSYGPAGPCGMENWPGVYTKVSDYMKWIVSKLKP